MRYFALVLIIFWEKVGIYLSWMIWGFRVVGFLVFEVVSLSEFKFYYALVV